MRSLLCLMIFLFLLTSSVAFVNSRTNHGKSFQQKLKLRNSHENQVFDPMGYSFKDNDKFSKEILALGILLMPCSEAFAKDGAYGIFEGRTASMLHPVTMFALFATSLYSASLGLKWRQLRYIGEEIKTKSSELPNLSSGKAKFPISEQVSSIQTQLSSLKTSAQVDSNAVSLLEKDLSLLNNAKELDSTITELSKTRKDLQGANLRDKHWISGSTVLGVGVGVSILGYLNILDYAYLEYIIFNKEVLYDLFIF